MSSLSQPQQPKSNEMASGNRKPWKEEDMRKAIEMVRQNKISIARAARKFMLPRSTLPRWANSKLKTEKAAANKIGRPPILGFDLEKKLVEYALMMKDKFYGITREDLRRMAYVFAKKQNKKVRFKSNMTFGTRWVYKFLERHKNLVDFVSHDIHYFSGLECSVESVTDFFNNLNRLYIQHQYLADRIFNVEAASLLVLQNKTPEVFVCKGKKRIASLIPNDRKGLITMIFSMSASGFFVPPMLIFPEHTMQVELMNGAPPCSIGVAHPSGWVQHHLFTRWFIHFIEKVKPTQESPVVLILDGQQSYTRNLEIINMAEENNVEIVSVIPSLGSHMQPIVETLIQPLKNLYAAEVENWSLENDRHIEPFDLAEIFSRAYLQMKTGEVAVNGFRSTGIYPLDKAVLLDRFSSRTKERLKKSVTKKAHFVFEKLKCLSPNPIPGPSKLVEIKTETPMLPMTEVWLEDGPNFEYNDQSFVSENTND
ncbi:uncharacterized protein LOC117174750 [Belonocnema kinseyi]|uniref:uncharacterized protein LOC117174750 n=1 Tax=Belonocnema kinseyi TaxID=2817044 RepID=UPI00143D5063|nr:uncharacterized protein LOC117174750 [Belonocnema kinseyi]